MGIFLGKEELSEALSKIKTKNVTLYSRLSAEKEIGELLEKYLPEDTYVVAHPQIGGYDPDFLVISSRFGCRVIEVQSWSPEEITEIEPDGKITLKDGRRINLTEQIRKYRDELSIYLDTNLGMTNITIEGLIVHCRFTAGEFKDKVSKIFPPDYYRNILFKDQIDTRIEQRLKASSKYVNRGLIDSNIQTILSAIEISENIAQEKRYVQITKLEEEPAVEEDREQDREEPEENSEGENGQKDSGPEEEQDLENDVSHDQDPQVPQQGKPGQNKTGLNWRNIAIALFLLIILICGSLAVKNLPSLQSAVGLGSAGNNTGKNKESGTIDRLVNGADSTGEQEMMLTVTKFLDDSRNQIIF